MVSSADVKVQHAEPGNALIRTLVFDSKTGRAQEDWWSMSAVPAKAKFHLGGISAVEKSLAGYRWTVGKRELEVAFGPFQQLSGTQAGFTYEVEWAQKQANQALEPTPTAVTSPAAQETGQP